MKHIVAIALITVLASCGRAVTRNTEKTQVSEKSNEQIIDKSKTETNRKVDTTVSTKADSVKQILKQSEMDEAFADGDSVVTKTTKSGHLTLTTSYNKNTKEFSAEAKKDKEDIKVHVDETIKKENDITTTKEKEVEQKSVVKHVEKESNFNATKVGIWIAAIIGVVILIIALIKLPNFNKK